jgi:hypothetical protein
MAMFLGVERGAKAYIGTQRLEQRNATLTPNASAREDVMRDKKACMNPAKKPKCAEVRDQ